MKARENMGTDNYYSVKEDVQKYIDGCKTKMNVRTHKVFGRAILAGMMIAFGASASNVAAHAVTNVGLSRLVAGCVFPVGLMMVVLLGAELFTGDCLMAMGNAEGTCTILDLCKFLLVVYVGNFAGSVLLAIVNVISGQLNYSSGLLGAYTIKVAMGKVNLSFGQALCSGILCNILVCAAVLMAMCARDIVGKLFACFFTIMLFVVAGYEHCVANMYYIPAGLIASKNANYAQIAMDTYGYTADQLASLNLYGFFVKNLVPVTIGNIIGGAVLGLILLYLHGDEKKKR